MSRPRALNLKTWLSKNLSIVLSIMKLRSPELSSVDKSALPLGSLVFTFTETEKRSKISKQFEETIFSYCVLSLSEE